MPEDLDGALGRFIAALKKTEPADPRRISRIVRAAVGSAGATPLGWWARRRTFTVRAIAGGAAAATLLGLVLGGALNSALRGAENTLTASAPAGMDPLPIPLLEAAIGADVGEQPLSVQFLLVAPEAHSVALVGDFNGWDPTAVQLQRDAAGIWSGTIMLPPGRHAYSFIVDDSIWTPDPKAPTVEDADFGRPHSVRVFGGM